MAAEKNLSFCMVRRIKGNLAYASGIPGGAVIKNLSANAGDAREESLIPGSGRSLRAIWGSADPLPHTHSLCLSHLGFSRSSPRDLHLSYQGKTPLSAPQARADAYLKCSHIQWVYTLTHELELVL